MRLLALEKAGDAFVGIVEDGDYYREFWATRAGTVMGHEYRKERYRDHRRFATIYGKFEPWPLFACDPPEIPDLEYETLEAIAPTMPTRAPGPAGERRDSNDLLRLDLPFDEWVKYMEELERKNREFKALPKEEQDRIHAANWDPGQPDDITDEDSAEPPAIVVTISPIVDTTLIRYSAYEPADPDDPRSIDLEDHPGWWKQVRGARAYKAICRQHPKAAAGRREDGQIYLDLREENLRRYHEQRKRKPREE